MKRKDNSILKKIGNKYMILPFSDHNISIDVILNTNEVGAFIYNALDNDITKEELLNMILEEYEVDERIAKRDLESFLFKMHEKGLLDD